MNYTKNQLCLIWLDGFSGLEYKHKYYLVQTLKDQLSSDKVLTVCKDYLIANVGEQAFNTIKASANLEYINLLTNELEQKGITAVTVYSKDYPQNLLNIENPPLVLYLKGDKSLLNGKNFAIVGSRKSLPSTLAVAKDYAQTLVDAGFTLVTGIAEGADEAVIKATLDNNGKVISVIAGGMDNVYPKSNQDLVEKVCQSGLVISEHPPQVVSKPYMYPVRNRIIAGLSQGVLVVSAGIKSGTMYTAHYAGEFGKDLFAIPYGIGVVSGAGCNELIKRGAILTDSPKDILDFYGISVEKAQTEFSPEEQGVINALKEGAKHVQAIADALNKKTFEIIPLLSTMEICGHIVKAGNVYQLTHMFTEE